MKGLSLFSKTSSKRLYNLAAYHSPHSLTWRWILSISFGGEGHFGFWNISSPTHKHFGFTIPKIAAVVFQTQQPMWYRDMYMRKRDEEDRRRVPLYTSVRDPRIVSDGGTAIH